MMGFAFGAGWAERGEGRPRAEREPKPAVGAIIAEGGGALCTRDSRRSQSAALQAQPASAGRCTGASITVTRLRPRALD